MRWSIAGLAGSLGAAGVDLVYLNAIRQQGGGPPGYRVPFVAAWIFACAAVGAWGAVAPQENRRSLALGVAAAGLFVMGIVGLWSIGLPLLMAAALVAGAAVAAAGRAGVRRGVMLIVPIGLVIAAAALLALGIALT